MLGDLIFKRRKQLGMSQKQLAEKCGVSNKAVSKWETYEANPDTDTLLPLASALQISVDELLTGEFEKISPAKLSAPEALPSDSFPVPFHESVRQKVLHAISVMALILFVPLFLFCVFCSVLALADHSNNFETTELIGIALFFLILAILCGIPVLLAARFLENRHHKVKAFESQIAIKNTFTLYSALEKSEKKQLLKQFRDENRALFLGTIVINALLICSYFLSIILRACNVFVPIILAVLNLVFALAGAVLSILLMVRKNDWFRKKNIYFSYRQFRKNMS